MKVGEGCILCKFDYIDNKDGKRYHIIQTAVTDFMIHTLYDDTVAEAACATQESSNQKRAVA